MILSQLPSMARWFPPRYPNGRRPLSSWSTVAWAKPLQALTFSLVQVDENGNSVEGGHSAEAVNDAEGKIVFDGITYGPRNIADTYWYQMTGKSSDELAAIYRMDTSVKTIKVVLQKGAEGVYLISYEVTDNGDGAPADTVVFNNETIPEVPDNPDNPNNPGNPGTPGKPEASDDSAAPKASGDLMRVLSFSSESIWRLW